MAFVDDYLVRDMRRYYGGNTGESCRKLRISNIAETAIIAYNQALLMPQSCRKTVKFSSHDLIYRKIN
jgi:hypothetical protein